MTNPLFTAEAGAASSAQEAEEAQAQSDDWTAWLSTESDAGEGAGETSPNPNASSSSAKASATPTEETSQHGKAPPISDIASVFATAETREATLADPDGPVDAAGSPTRVVVHRAIPVHEAMAVVDADGTHILVDPEGRRGEKADYLVQTPRGRVRAMSADELEAATAEGQRVVEQHGQSAHIPSVGVFGLTMAALLRAHYRREHQQDLVDAAHARQAAEHSAIAQRRYQEWVAEQIRSDAHTAQEHYAAAQQSYREMLDDPRLREHIAQLSALRAKRGSDNHTIDDEFDTQKTLRHIERRVRDDPTLASYMAQIRDHTDTMNERVNTVFRTLEEHPQLQHQFRDIRLEMPGEREMRNLQQQFGDLTRGGNSDDDEARMEKLRELAATVVATIRSLFHNDEQPRPQ